MRYGTIALVLIFLAPPVLGQATGSVTPGQRIWVRSTRGSRSLDAGIKGTLEEVTSDSLRIRPSPEGPVVSVPVRPETRLFVFTGRRSSSGRGAAIGAGVGVIAGAIIGFAGGEDCSTNELLCFDRGMVAAAGAVALGGAGLFGGAIVGALVSHETWKQARWSATVHPVVSPDPRGMRLGLSLGF